MNVETIDKRQRKRSISIQFIDTPGSGDEAPNVRIISNVINSTKKESA